MRICVAGDFCPQDRVADIIEKGDFESVLGDVLPYIERGDFSIVNFECPVTNGVEKPIPKQGPSLSCSSKGIEAVKWAGFDCVTLANNHFYDYGEEGVANTLNACKANGLDMVGGGMDIEQASKTLFKNIQGQTVAVINCCEHEFSIATSHSAGSNPLNPVQQYYAIQEARQKADFVLVIVHGGYEHFQLPSVRMVETYRFFIDAGADVVVNHHQHCFSGYEIYKNKPIIYGLGNFCFDNPSVRSGIWTEGYIVSINLEADGISFELTPYRQCADVPCVEVLPQSSYQNRLEELNSTITDSDKLESALNAYLGLCCSGYSVIFEPLNSRYYLGAKRRGWLPSLISKSRKLLAQNFVLCESHREKLQYWFERK